MLTAFGVQDSRIGKALTDEQKRTEQKRTAAGAGAAGATVYGYQAGTSVRARNTARHMADPARAQSVAHSLAQHPGHAFGAGENPFNGMREQAAAYKDASAGLPDVKRVRDTADRWSSTFRQVKRIRRAYDKDAPTPGLGRALLRPIKAKSESDSNVMRSLNNAKTPSPTLFRGMRTDQRSYKVGDEVNMHDLSSWSANEGVADVFAARGKDSKGTAHVFERAPGHGTSYEAASPQFQQREWVAGGKHRVVGHSPSGAVRIARIVKSAGGIGRSPFGVDDNRI